MDFKLKSLKHNHHEIIILSTIEIILHLKNKYIVDF